MENSKKLGIYSNDILDYLKKNLDPVTNNYKNIICRCPFCEKNVEKDHYHFYISLEAPIFHCFYCEKRGFLSTVFEHLDGVDLSDNYIDKNEIKRVKIENIKSISEFKTPNIIIPPIDQDKFKNKTLFIKKRLKYFNTDIKNIKGLVFDIDEFIKINKEKILISETFNKVQEYFQHNFVGFITNNKSVLFLRNIDPNSTFTHFKHQLYNNKIFDYYSLRGLNPSSNIVILSEGIFDILCERNFDMLNLRKDALLYACGLSKSYSSLLKSIVFNEQIFKLDVFILSDIDVDLDIYKKIKYFNKYLINSITICYNKSGKDFGDTPNSIEKIII